MQYVGYFSTDPQIVSLYDSIQIPLFICQNKVFKIESECLPQITEKSKEYRESEKRSRGTVNNYSNEQNDNGKIKERNSAGQIIERNSGSDVEIRKSEGRVTDRNEGGLFENRKSEGRIDTRNNSGAFSSFECHTNPEKMIIIYFQNVLLDKTSRIYYNNRFYKLSENKFKIQKL